ncbi:protein hinderin isoform X1 [Erpetoichthys calabaricus]|uniref:protein hinderin isoform X1 n=2 Tax=Erpetoichthys calabaricus TaxID=27687 RepID=UPI0022347400|nr:protein hinderin isoform X1 [Erpetoichthys calabaricus]
MANFVDHDETLGPYWTKDTSDEEQPMVFIAGLMTSGTLQMQNRAKNCKADDKKKVAHHTPNTLSCMSFKKAQVKNTAVEQVSSEKAKNRNPSFKDLCQEDKRRIAVLIQELARLSEEKEESVERFKAEQESFEKRIQQLEKQNKLIEHEREALRQQYKECQELLASYQQYLTEEQEKLSHSISQARLGRTPLTQLSQPTSQTLPVSITIEHLSSQSDKLYQSMNQARPMDSFHGQQDKLLPLSGVLQEQPFHASHQDCTTVKQPKDSKLQCYEVNETPKASLTSKISSQLPNATLDGSYIDHVSSKTVAAFGTKQQSTPGMQKISMSGLHSQSSVLCTGTEQENNDVISLMHHDKIPVVQMETLHECINKHEEACQIGGSFRVPDPLMEVHPSSHEACDFSSEVVETRCGQFQKTKMGERRQKLLQQKQQLEKQKEQLQVMLAQQEERLLQHQQNLWQNHLDFKRCCDSAIDLEEIIAKVPFAEKEKMHQKTLGSISSRRMFVSPIKSPPGPMSQDRQKIQSPTHKYYRRGGLQCGTEFLSSENVLPKAKGSCSVFRKKFATPPVPLIAPTVTYPQQPNNGCDTSLIELLNSLSPISKSVQRRTVAAQQPMEGSGRTCSAPRFLHEEEDETDFQESQILEDIFFIC